MNIIVRIKVLKEIFYIVRMKRMFYTLKDRRKKREREKKNNGNISFLDVLVDS